MSIPREGSRDTSRGIVISKYPDVCRSPTVPVPYTIVGRQSDDAGTAATVRMTGQRAHKQSSIITQVSGDEPGTGLGVKSGTVGSVCHRKSHSASVRIEGEWATRHGDEWWMNNKNTIGKLTWVESTETFEPTPPFIQLAQVSPTTVTDAAPPLYQPPPVEGGSAGELSVPRGGALQPPTDPVEPPPEGSKFWKHLKGMAGAMRSGGGPSGPGMMNAMGYIESEILKPYVNTPDRWISHGVFRQPRTPAPIDPNAPIPPPLQDIPTSGVPTVEEQTETATQPEEVTDVAPDQGRTDETVRITEEDKRNRNCRLRPYKEGCGDAAPYSTPHHIVADRAFRHPGKGGAVYQDGGIPHAEGLTICVDGGTPIFSGENANEHGLIHAIYDGDERRVGLRNTPTGTAKLEELERIGVRAAATITGCPAGPMLDRL